jgi:hypothetical protein
VGNAKGAVGGYTIADLTLKVAYNEVSGTVINGFGGGPYFTSAEDHTVAEAEDQKALALGVEYSGVEALRIGLFHIDFDQGANETDYYVLYDLDEHLGFELIYADIHEDGEFVRFMANYAFFRTHENMCFVHHGTLKERASASDSASVRKLVVIIHGLVPVSMI